MRKISYSPISDSEQIFLYNTYNKNDYCTVIVNVPAASRIDPRRIIKKDKDLKGVWKIKSLNVLHIKNK
jgi:hypothetical protein